jgi:dTDP-4-dehydrorhamnose 3,5-epimerase
MPFTFESTELPGVLLAIPDVFPDERGQLLESYDRESFVEAGIDCEFVLDFYSRSQENVIRGLHIQLDPAAQAKLVHVIQGEIFDVVVDLRQGSDTFGEYLTRSLGGEEKEILYVPEGFAHGYLVQSNETIVHYKGTAPFAPEHVNGVAWDDGELDIEWPLEEEPVISDQDQEWPRLDAWREVPEGPT